MTRSHWRLVAGVGVLVTGLLVNAGGAVALADSGSDSSSGGDGAGPASHADPHQSGPLGGLPKTVRSTVQGVTNALGPGQQARQQPITGSTSGSLIAAVPQMMAQALRGQTPVTGLSVAQKPTVSTDDPVTAPAAVPAPDPGPAADGVLGAPNPVTEALAATTDLVAPAPVAVAAGVPSLVAPVTEELATGLTAPIPDVLTSLRDVITSTADAFVPVTQVPSDLASLLGFPGLQFASPGASAHPGWPSTAAMPSPLSTVRPPTDERGAISALGGPGETGATATAGPSAHGADVGASAPNSRASTAPAGAASEGLQAFFRSYGALVIAASLSALVAAALPGLIALLLPTAAGVGVGYRQARAGIALRASGIARFAGSGPLGIVRSGALVALRPSALRSARTDADSAELAA